LGLELYWQGVIAGSVIVIEVLMTVFGMADTQPLTKSRSGVIHTIMGEDGAGKSTLM
jgi:ABC-type uncharacterized transport system ATPase subunit